MQDPAAAGDGRWSARGGQQYEEDLVAGFDGSAHGSFSELR
jgi:hypothetical protein